MKVHSIVTQFITSSNMLEATSKTSFKEKPFVGDTFDVFNHPLIEKSVNEHLKTPAHKHIVSVRTTMGTFIKTYKLERGLNETR